jgi:serine/threonine-protein kinase
MSETTSRLNEALSGRYEIERKLGEGGMATVYLAHDERHDRSVAIKVLRPELAAVIGSERFLAEIRMTANLQHPHILTLHDSGDADGLLYYVMPYIDGESLRDRLDRERQLPVEEAVRLSVHIAEALDYAHRHGVIHRDIKPANILLHEGQPMIADFGIAKAVSTVGAGRLTETGMSLGTPSYMSPEQATGDQEVTAATDTYSLACVLYEMLTGEPPFTGPTAQAILARILADEPTSASTQRKSVPPSVDAALTKALERLPADRFPDTGEFARALEDPSFARKTAGLLDGPRGGRWTWITTVLALSTVVLAVVAARSFMRPGSAPPVLRLAVDLPEDQGLAAATGPRIAIAPDGRRLAYVGRGPGQPTRIWIRDLDRLRATAIPETEGASSPVFSPDGRAVAFLQASAIRTAPTAGGPPTTLTDGIGGDFAGALSWGDDGFIYLAHRGLFRVPMSGGDLEAVGARDSLGRWHLHPEVLPGSRVVVFSLGLNETRVTNELAAVDLESGAMRVLGSGVMARYMTTGHLAIVEADGSLSIALFDEDRLEITGPVRKLDLDIRIWEWGATDLSLSPSGTLVYTTGSAEPRRQVVWVDRNGFEQPLDPAWFGPYESVALSPDGSRLAVGTGFGAEPQLWIRTLETGAVARLTLEGTLNRRPVWSDDGETLTFISQRGGNRDLYRKRADGLGEAEVVLDLERHVDEHDWSADGEWLVYRVGISGGEGRDIYARRRDGEDIVVAANPAFDERGPTLSPDSRLLAYQSSEAGRWNVYVRPFPEVESDRLQVSVNGGTRPVWSEDGDTLFFISGADSLVAARLRRAPRLELLSAERLFSTSGYFNDFDKQNGDDVFVFIKNDVSSGEERLVLVQGFFEELRQDRP